MNLFHGSIKVNTMDEGIKTLTLIVKFLGYELVIVFSAFQPLTAETGYLNNDIFRNKDHFRI